MKKKRLEEAKIGTYFYGYIQIYFYIKGKQIFFSNEAFHIFITKCETTKKSCL